MIHIKKHGQNCYIDGSLIPVLSKPFIDKLYITVKFLPESHEKIISGFTELEQNGDGLKCYKAAYEHNLKISKNFPDYAGEALLQCSPNTKKKDYNFFRLEMTPSRIDLNNLKTILDKTVPDGYEGVLKNGKVTRIDLSVDITNIAVSEIIATYPKMRVERHFGMGVKKQTKILGSPASNKSITLYDKVQEQKVFNKKHADTPNKLSKGNLTRLELSLKKTKITLAEIAVSPNPFKPLSLVAYPGCLSLKNYNPLWTLFLNVCQDHGGKAALAHFNKNDKDVYSYRLKHEGKSDWWKPGILWEGIQEAIEGLKIIKGNTPKISGVIGGEPAIEEYSH
jgi:hypothetical protein